MSLQDIESEWNDLEQQNIGFWYQSELLDIAPSRVEQPVGAAAPIIQAIVDSYFNWGDYEPSAGGAVQPVALVALLTSVSNRGDLGRYLEDQAELLSGRRNVLVEGIREGPDRGPDLEERILFGLSIDETISDWECSLFLYIADPAGFGYFNLVDCENVTT